MWDHTTEIYGAFAWICTSLALVILLPCIMMLISRSEDEPNRWAEFSFILLPMVAISSTGLMLYTYYTFEERNQRDAWFFLGLCVSYAGVSIPWAAAMLAYEE